MSRNVILVVDDVEINRDILKEIFQEEFQVIEAQNGREAIEKLRLNIQSIAIVLLDVVMPDLDGYQVMDWMKENMVISGIPVVLITGNQSEDMERRAYETGVSDIIHKPFNSYIVKRRITNIIELYQHKNSMEMLIGQQVQKLQEQNILLQEQTGKLEEINSAIIDTMSNVVEFRNLESGQHIKRIKKFTKCLAKSVAENCDEYSLDENAVRIITQASAMHDIGKIGIPDNILLKPGKLSKDEFEVMKTHTSLGCELIERIAPVQGEEYYEYCYEICRYHHERYDGKGYPDGLQGDEIPIAAQIVSIADVYDALVSDRVYKAAYTPKEACNMIQTGKCGVFSPKLIKCFNKVNVLFHELAQERGEEA